MQFFKTALLATLVAAVAAQWNDDEYGILYARGFEDGHELALRDADADADYYYAADPLLARDLLFEDYADAILARDPEAFLGFGKMGKAIKSGWNRLHPSTKNNIKNAGRQGRKNLAGKLSGGGSGSDQKKDSKTN